jgi:hypothetical protein
MKRRTFVATALAVLTLGGLWGYTQSGKANDDKDGKSQYKAREDTRTNAVKVVKLTVENKSGKDILLVSWRYWGPDYYYAVHLGKDAPPVMIDNFAAEWRIVGVWEDGSNPPVSQTGWGEAYNFDKDSTITINKDKLDIK